MESFALIKGVLDLGVVGLLAVALYTVVRGHWIPKILHDKMMEHQKAGYEAVIAQYKAVDEEKSTEIARLRTRNEEAMQVAMNQGLATTSMIEGLRMALTRGGYLSGPETDGNERRAS